MCELKTAVVFRILPYHCYYCYHTFGSHALVSLLSERF